MAWKTLSRWLRHLEGSQQLIRIHEPVDVEYEAGAIADLLVKNGGPAVIFEQPRLPDGTIASIPLVMNMFGTHERTLQALGVTHETEIGDRMVAMMKPDIGAYMKRPWKGLPLLKDALAMPPKKVRKGAGQRIRLPTDVTRLPIPKTWPMDGGQFVTLPLVVTKDPTTGEHNLGMYRSQVFGPTEMGLHWQIHKHAADHSASHGEVKKMPVALCMGGPPELIFSAIAPLPDNLSEYQFAGILGRSSLKITKALTQDLYVPAEADIIIEGYCIPGETTTEGPFGDHFGFYSLTGQYPVLHVTAITARKDAHLPATIVGLPPMEDGFLGEAIGKQFSPVLQFQHRDVIQVHLPLETGFHNLAIVAAKQRYPRQARKTGLGLLGAGQMMFLKIMVMIDAEDSPSDLDHMLDVLNDRVHFPTDLTILDGMVADALEAASPYENVHSKLLIDATSLPRADPRSSAPPVEGSFSQPVPAWRQGGESPPAFTLFSSVTTLPGVKQARMLRDSMLVVTIDVNQTPDPTLGMTLQDDEAEQQRREQIAQLKNSIWQLDTQKSLRWLFITNDDLDLDCEKARRRLLWQLTSRFDVERGLSFDEHKDRLCWDATTPIPSERFGVRRWPAVTFHTPETLEKISRHPELLGYSWPPHLNFRSGVE